MIDSTSSYTLFLCTVLYAKLVIKEQPSLILINVKLHVISFVTLLKQWQKNGKYSVPTQAQGSVRGRSPCMLTKHLLKIHRGLFLEFIFSSPLLPMISLLVHFREASALIRASGKHVFRINLDMC